MPTAQEPVGREQDGEEAGELEGIEEHGQFHPLNQPGDDTLSGHLRGSADRSGPLDRLSPHAVRGNRRLDAHPESLGRPIDVAPNIPLGGSPTGSISPFGCKHVPP